MTRPLPLVPISAQAERLRLEALACDVDHHCITCGDEAVEVVVMELLADGLALVDTGTDKGGEVVSVALVEARVGDSVLVHAKEALAVVAP